MIPTAVQLADNGSLQIVWEDGIQHEYPMRRLRDYCPCASCVEKRMQPAEDQGLPIFNAAAAMPLQLARLEPIGNYAYNIAFNDGHDTGIFTLEFLRKLGESLASHSAES